MIGAILVAMNPAIIVQALARAVYNRSPEPLGHFSDSQPSMSREDAKQILARMTAAEHKAATSHDWLKVMVVLAVVAIICVMIYH